MLGRPYVALVALATVLRAERVADDGWLPQCTVDFEYASCFPCRSTDAAAVLKERCLFVSALMNATNCVFEDGFFNSTAGANVTWGDAYADELPRRSASTGDPFCEIEWNPPTPAHAKCSEAAAALAVGYDDRMAVGNAASAASTQKTEYAAKSAADEFVIAQPYYTYSEGIHQVDNPPSTSHIAWGVLKKTTCEAGIYSLEYFGNACCIGSVG